MENNSIVIIGNGISGITCARHIRKNGGTQPITIISSESEHFYARTALMYIYMGHMKYEHTKPYEDFFWEKNNLKLVLDTVKSLDAKAKKINLEIDGELSFSQLIIASGSASNFPDWPGIKLRGVQGLYNLSDLKNMEELTKDCKKAVVVGGGLIGIELAEMLASRQIEVHLIIREKTYWSNILPALEGEMINRHIAEHHIHLHTASEVEEILEDNGGGRAVGVKLKDGHTLECTFVGISIGVHPNIEFLKGSGIETDKGILINNFFETNMPDIFAVGDCIEFHQPPATRRKLEQIWYTGKIHGETLALTLTGKRTEYQPGPMFNSAKFLDIEYQTYGYVPAEEEDGQESFYWEHPNGKICFRLCYAKASGELIGFHGFGLRLRHAVANAWLTEKVNADHVITHLNDVMFDPEFYTKHQKAIISSYNQKRGKNLRLQSKGWRRILQFSTTRNTTMTP